MSATIRVNIPLASSIIAHAKRAQIINGLYSASLISLGQLCDDDCVTILDHNEINILNFKTLILKGHRNKTDGLWEIPIPIPVMHCASNIFMDDVSAQHQELS